LSFHYEFARAALAVDCVVFGLDEGDLKVMLIRRNLPPFQGRWAFPGGFVRIDETTEEAARRELREETGMDQVFLEQLYTFSDLNRDPRERVVSVAYYALIRLSNFKVQAATDASDANWFQLNEIPKLPFDHKSILDTAYDRLKTKVRYQPIGFELLPLTFTLTQLQKLYESVLARPIDKRNFRKKILNMDILFETGEMQSAVAHRAARLYRFNKKQYQALVKNGFHFEI
jgi:8-oxo-dGTP diphosphatase